MEGGVSYGSVKVVREVSWGEGSDELEHKTLVKDILGKHFKINYVSFTSGTYLL